VVTKRTSVHAVVATSSMSYVMYFTESISDSILSLTMFMLVLRTANPLLHVRAAYVGHRQKIQRRVPYFRRRIPYFTWATAKKYHRRVPYFDGESPTSDGESPTSRGASAKKNKKRRRVPYF
jgi:hypothetical protein